MKLRTSVLLAATAITACVAKPVPKAPAPRPVSPAPAPLPPPPPANWADRPLTPGEWAYRQDGQGAAALYGPAGATPVLVVRCDQGASAVFVQRSGLAAGRMTLRATTGARAYPATPTAGSPGAVAIRLTPRDPQLDALAFSRGRFLVGLDGAADVIVPSWPEVSRVIEDCRR